MTTTWETAAAEQAAAAKVTLPGCDRCRALEAHNAELTAHVADLEKQVEEQAKRIQQMQQQLEILKGEP